MLLVIIVSENQRFYQNGKKKKMSSHYTQSCTITTYQMDLVISMEFLIFIIHKSNENVIKCKRRRRRRKNPKENVPWTLATLLHVLCNKCEWTVYTLFSSVVCCDRSFWYPFLDRNVRYCLRVTSKILLLLDAFNFIFYFKWHFPFAPILRFLYPSFYAIVLLVCVYFVAVYFFWNFQRSTWIVWVRLNPNGLYLTSVHAFNKLMELCSIHFTLNRDYIGKLAFDTKCTWENLKDHPYLGNRTNEKKKWNEWKILWEWVKNPHTHTHTKSQKIKLVNFVFG